MSALCESLLWCRRDGRGGGAFSALAPVKGSGRKDTAASGSREGPSRSARHSARGTAGGGGGGQRRRPRAARGASLLAGVLPFEALQEARVRPASLPAQAVKAPPATQGDPLEEGTAAHSRAPAWRVPWTEEPGGLQPRVGQAPRQRRRGRVARATASLGPPLLSRLPLPPSRAPGEGAGVSKEGLLERRTSLAPTILSTVSKLSNSDLMKFAR